MNPLLRTSRLLALCCIAAVLALEALVATPSSAFAAPVPVRQEALRAYYGAIAISVDQAYGYSYDYATRRAAKRSALNRCERHTSRQCFVTVWVRNGCAATAVKVNSRGFVTQWAWGLGFRRHAKAKAKRHALAELSRPRFVLAWVCTTR